MTSPCGDNRWARFGILARPRDSNFALPDYRARLVYAQVDQQSAAILFATAKDAEKFIAFCRHYIEVCQSPEPYETYLRPNDSGVRHAEVVHLSLSPQFLTRMLSRLKATLCREKFFEPGAEAERVNVVSSQMGEGGVRFHFDGEEIYVAQPSP
jgi:hypothetical protein